MGFGEAFFPREPETNQVIAEGVVRASERGGGGMVRPETGFELGSSQLQV